MKEFASTDPTFINERYQQLNHVEIRIEQLHEHIQTSPTCIYTMTIAKGHGKEWHSDFDAHALLRALYACKWSLEDYLIPQHS